MKLGVHRIFEERNEQIFKHNYSIERDVKFNGNHELGQAAARLLFTPADAEETTDLMHEDIFVPKGWNKDIWFRMVNKTYEERLVIAGALIAAELDRLQYIKENS